MPVTDGTPLNIEQQALRTLASLPPTGDIWAWVFICAVLEPVLSGYCAAHADCTFVPSPLPAFHSRVDLLHAGYIERLCANLE